MDSDLLLLHQLIMMTLVVLPISYQYGGGKRDEATEDFLLKHSVPPPTTQGEGVCPDFFPYCNSHCPLVHFSLLSSERFVLMDRLQTVQELVIRAAWRGHSLKDRLESSAVQFLINLVPVEIHGH